MTTDATGGGRWPTLDFKPLIDDYFQKGLTAKENANMSTMGPAGLLLVVGGAALKIDYLHRLREAGHSELVDMHESGRVHIHDLTLGWKTPYCAGHSLSNLLSGGISAGAIKSGPAKRLRSAINHIINYIGASSNEFAGAQAFNDVDLFLGPYAYDFYISVQHKCPSLSTEDAMTLVKDEVEQSLQEMIFHLNYNTRYGGQSPFSNISLALDVPDDMKHQRPLIGGMTLEERWGIREDDNYLTYAALQYWQNMVAEAIIDNFDRGDVDGKGFTFPVLSINAVPELFSHPLKKKIFALSAKYGNPYYQNYINGHSGDKKLDPSDVRSMCCRLQIDKKMIEKHTGGAFGNGDQTGSIMVITLNYPMLAMDALTRVGAGAGEDAVFQAMMDEVAYVGNLIKKAQLWKRKVVEQSWEEGFFPMAKTNLTHGFDTFYTTLGFVGLWEAIEVITGKDDGFFSERGLAYAKDVLTMSRQMTRDWNEETDKLFNFEATPAESAAYKLCLKMLKEYPDAPHRGTAEAPYLTNSCHIPVEYCDNVPLLLHTQSTLQPILTGGTVVHLHTGEQLTADGVEAMVKTMCATKIPFFSVSPIYSRCECCGRIIPGDHEYCPYDHTDEQIAALRKRRPDLLDED